MIQKSYEENKYGNLYIVPTPIGNIDDMTKRSIDTLLSSYVILAEDTRETKKLLDKLNIHVKTKACHKFNESSIKDEIINILKDNHHISLVTDRGTPLISDPGYIIVRECIKNKINVIALPGASALLPALNMSGIESEKFLFYGFLNSKESAAKKELFTLNQEKFTIILYESPHRLNKTLQNILKIMGNRQISISREITKLYESIFRGTVEEAIESFSDVKGEIVIVIEKQSKKDFDIDALVKEAEGLIDKNTTKKDAVNVIAKKYNISKNVLYNKVGGK